MSDDRDQAAPASLEPPSLFRRKRRSKEKVEPVAEPGVESAAEPAAEPGVESAAEPGVEPGVESAVEPAVEQDPETPAGPVAEPIAEVAEQPAVPGPDDAARPVGAPISEPISESEVDAHADADADAQPTEAVAVAPAPTAVLPVPAPAPARAPSPAQAGRTTGTADAAPPLFADEVAPEPAVPPPPAAPQTPAAPRTPLAPVLTGLAAAVVTGLLVGALVVLLTAGGQRACEAAQGTATCGKAGYPLVLAILVVAIIAGGALLRWSQVPDPTSTSFLAVGLLAVTALLFLVEQLDSWWMLAVIPLVSMATYAVSHWVTTAVIEPARE